MRSTLNKFLQTTLVMFLIILLTAGNLFLIGSKIAVYAEENLETQNEKTQSANVEMGAFFVSENKLVHSLVSAVNDNPKIYLHLNVKDSGYLKDAKISFNNANYTVLKDKLTSPIIANKNDNQIILNQINHGTEEIIEVPIKLDIEEKFNISNISKDSTITLTGAYIDNNGQEIQIKKDTNINLTWNGLSEVKGTSKIITYQENDNKTIIQEKVELESIKKSLPINKTKLEIEIPNIDGVKPEEVTVFASRTYMTNGKDYKDNDVKSNYNEESGILTIEVENKQTKGEVYSGLDKDEYIITYKYDVLLEDETDIITKSKYTIINYGNNNDAVKTIANTTALKDKFGNYLDGRILTESINKAKMYANSNSNDQKIYETEYSLIEEVVVLDKNLSNEIILEQADEYFTDEKQIVFSTKIEDEYYTYYKEIKINKENLEEILGKDGTITILDEEGKVIDVIDESKEAKDGVYSVTLKSKNSNITIKTSKPIAEGILKIESIKGIKADLNYSKEQLQSFTELVEVIDIKNESTKTIKASSKLEEAVNHLNLEISKDVIDSKDEEIEIKVELGNNTNDSVLYEEPTVLVSLPDFVESVEVLRTNILFEDELKIEQVETGNIGENKAIKVDLSGTQTKFNNVKNSNGTTLVLGTKLTSKQEEGTGEIIASVGKNYASTEIISILKPEETVPVLNMGENTDANLGNDSGDEIFTDIASDQEDKRIKPGDEITYTVYVTGKFTHLDVNEDWKQSIREELGRPDMTDEEILAYIDTIVRKETIKNVVGKDVLPEGVTFKEASIRIQNIETNEQRTLNTVTYDSATRVLTWNVGEIKREDIVYLTVKVVANTLPENVFEKEIKNSAMIIYDFEAKVGDNTLAHFNNKTQTTSETTTTIATSHLNITKENVNIKDVNTVNDEVKLIVNVFNNGAESTEVTSFKMTLPNEFMPIEMEEGYTNDVIPMSYSKREIDEEIPALQPNEGYTIAITGLVDLDLNYKEHYKDVTLTALVNGQEVSWDIKIENPDFINPNNQNETEQPNNQTNPNNQNEPQQPDNTNNINNPDNTNETEQPDNTNNSNNTNEPEQPNNTNETEQPNNQTNNTGSYSISGVAWIDENRDGIMQTQETLLQNVKTSLMQSGKTIKETYTDNDGKYTFTDLSQGEYQVAFAFDGEKYRVTDYRKTGNTQTSSSAIGISGKKSEAITDVFMVSSGVLNINIGLVKLTKFDMSLTKTVNKIIVNTKEGTKTYDFGGNIAKVDIAAKYLDGAEVLVEYKLIIKNEGELAGTVKSVVDYMPKEMAFSTDLNRTWVQASDGNLYNSELKSIKIEPGETKELLLVLTKTMTGDNVGLFNNTAELSDVGNSENIPDTDSTPGNRKTGEDDMSSADVLIGIKTGEEITYVTLIIVALIIFITGAYIINKKVLKGLK